MCVVCDHVGGMFGCLLICFDACKIPVVVHQFCFLIVPKDGFGFVCFCYVLFIALVTCYLCGAQMVVGSI